MERNGNFLAEIVVSVVDAVACVPDECDDDEVFGRQLLFCFLIGWGCREWPCGRLKFWTGKSLFHKCHT